MSEGREPPSQHEGHLGGHSRAPVDRLLKQRQCTQVGMRKVYKTKRPCADGRQARRAPDEAGGGDSHGVPEETYVKPRGECTNVRVSSLQFCEDLVTPAHPWRHGHASTRLGGRLGAEGLVVGEDSTA